MDFNKEIAACVMWLISAVLILTSVIASPFFPLYGMIWNILQSVSFGVMALALFIFSIGFSDKDKNMSQLSLVSSLCSIILFAVLIFSDPTTLFMSQGFILQTITLVAIFAASLFLFYLGSWIYNSKYRWQTPNPALFAVVLNIIAALLLFSERVATLTFYKLNISYVIIIFAMIANIYFFKKIKIE